MIEHKMVKMAKLKRTQGLQSLELEI